MLEKDMAIGINLFNLKGKRALVTGSSQGIGYALAKGLDQAGAEIILNGRDKIKLDKSAKTIEAKQKLFQLSFDVTDYNETKQVINNFESEFGAIDILINNAGMQHRTPLEDFPPEMFEQLLKTKLNNKRFKQINGNNNNYF